MSFGINNLQWLMCYKTKPNSPRLHLLYLKEKCSKVLKFLHVIAHTEWGANYAEP